MIDDLRANYAPTEKRRLYPWMINISEDPEPGAIGKLQRVIVKFSLWTSLPLVLILIALWYVKKHEPTWSYVVGSAPIVGTSIVVWFWCQYESVQLRGFIRKNIGKCFLTLIVLGFEIIYLFFLIPWAFNASLIYIGGGSKIEQALIPWLYVDLSSQKLVKEQEAQHKTLYWVDLGGVHLEGANLWGSILTKAYLKNANLLKAYIYNADLEGAILRNANLQAAVLMGANLRGADFWNANLEGAWLEEADLDDAILENANLSYAHLQKTLHLTVDQLSSVKTLYKAQLSPEHLERIKKDYPHLLEKPKPDVE